MVSVPVMVSAIRQLRKKHPRLPATPALAPSITLGRRVLRWTGAVVLLLRNKDARLTAGKRKTMTQLLKFYTLVKKSFARS